jgi:hypothetical protein
LEKAQKHVLNMKNMYKTMFCSVLNKKQCFVFILFDLKKTPLCPMTSTSGFQCFEHVYVCLDNIRGGPFSIIRWFLKSSLRVLSNNHAILFKTFQRQKKNIVFILKTWSCLLSAVAAPG